MKLTRSLASVTAVVLVATGGAIGSAAIAAPATVDDATRLAMLTDGSAEEPTTPPVPPPATAPSAATAVRVSGSATATTRTVTWTAPAQNGGLAVTYRVHVRAGSATLLDKRVTTTSLPIARRVLTSGTHHVSVTASNRAGSATAATATFAVTAVKPTKVGTIKVKGKSRAAKRTITWKAPAWDGGSKIKSYQVVAKHSGRIVFVSKIVKAPKRTLKINTRLMAYGKYTVTVRAKNAKGYGPRSKGSFTRAF